MYLDNTEELISSQQRVTRPPDYIRYTAILFYHWYNWAEEHNQEKMDMNHINQNVGMSNITPFGTKIGPVWMKIDFNNLEEFYNYYYELLGAKNGR